MYLSSRFEYLIFIETHHFTFKGTYSSGNSTGCSTCQAGFECPRIDMNSPIPCANGTYAVAGQVVS